MQIVLYEYMRHFELNCGPLKGGKSLLKTSQKMRTSTAPWATWTPHRGPQVIRWVMDPLVSLRSAGIVCFSIYFSNDENANHIM